MKSAPSFWTHDSDASDSDSHDAEVPVAGTPRVLVTPILIAVSLVVSILMVSNGVSWLDPPANDLVRWGANYGPLTTHGQQWRIVTAAFVNIDLIHLLANVAVLAIIGTVTERLSGAAGFAVLYLLSGIGANIVSLAWHPFVIVAGASTANFGLLGGLAAFRLLRPDALPRPRRKVQAWRVYAMLLAILPYGYTDRIDIGVHLAGLATGFLVGCGLAYSPLTANSSGRLARSLIVALSGIAITAALAAWTPAVDDLGIEIQQYAPLEKRSAKIFNESLDKLKSHEMRPEEFSEVVERELLPPWNAARERISKLRVAEAQRPRATSIQEYMSLRAEGWSLTAKAVRANDLDIVRSANEKQAAAEALAKKLNPDK